jgi:glycosyltransferase involved in cell wall biosynthesis
VGYEHLRDLAKDKSRVHLSYHGLDLNRFPPSERELSVRDGSAASNPVVILSVGRAVKKKGYDILLRALSQLPEDLHWKFIHVGDGSEIEAMKMLAHELGVGGRIVWAGAINQRVVLSHYQQADVFALACRITADGDRDGLPNVLVEAASQSLACVSTRVSGIQELFVDQLNGLLVESESPEQLANALSRAIKSPSLRLELGKRAESRVRETLDYRTSVQQLIKLFADARAEQYDR